MELTTQSPDQIMAQAVKMTTSVCKHADHFYNQFPNYIAGVTWASEVIPTAVILTLRHELRDMFTKGELCTMLDVTSKNQEVLLTAPDLSGQIMVPLVMDAFDLYPDAYQEKWEVNKRDLINKLSTATRFQLISLEVWVAFFKIDGRPTERAIEDYCQSFLDSRF